MRLLASTEDAVIGIIFLAILLQVRAHELGYGLNSFMSSGFIAHDGSKAKEGPSGQPRALLNSQPPRRCLQDPETGPCRASLTRFFYNSTSQRCEEFIYGGCRGNDNNFQSKEECEEICMEGPAPDPDPSPVEEPSTEPGIRDLEDALSGRSSFNPVPRAVNMPPPAIDMPPQEPEGAVAGVSDREGGDAPEAGDDNDRPPNDSDNVDGDSNGDGVDENGDSAGSPAPASEPAPEPDNSDHKPPSSGGQAQMPFIAMWILVAVIVIHRLA